MWKEIWDPSERHPYRTEHGLMLTSLRIRGRFSPATAAPADLRPKLAGDGVRVSHSCECETCRLKIRAELQADDRVICDQSAAAGADDVVIEEAAPAPRKVAKVDEGAAKRAAASADALSALVNLGYGQGDAAQAVATVSGDMVDADAAALIRAALKVLAPK